MAYLLDANCFIQAKKREYGFDFCPAYWDWLSREHATGKILSIERIRDEILVVSDDLAEWAISLPTAFFIRPDAAALQSMATLSAWASGGNYDPAAVSEFFSAADYFLVGQAMSGHHTVVTHEVVEMRRKKIKIPNACISVGVKCMSPYEMLRAEGARFVLP